MSFQEITQFEKKLYDKGIKYVAGIDEVGRGPLAGPFVVSAVILDLDKIFNPDFQKLHKKISLHNPSVDNNALTERIKGKMNKKVIGNIGSTNNDVLYEGDLGEKIILYSQIRDSKKVTPKRREILSKFIISEAISYSIEVFEPEEIDNLGISKLTQKAFFQAIKKLNIKPQFILTDTFEVAKITKQHQLNIINGDNKSISIASASIVAKVFRDKIMVKMHENYPVYGFDRHKGYGTKIHIQALHEHGPCEIHRKSFEPTKSILKLKKIN